MHEDRTEIPYGFCECGCGQKTTISVQDHPGHGWVKGEPMRFVRGHNNRGKQLVGYAEEDRGHATRCWIWQGFIHPSGYGSAGSVFSRSKRAHRVYYEKRHGPVPPGLVLDHLCGIKACVNPDHLEAVSNAENTRRGGASKLTADDVREIRRRLEHGGRGTGAALAREFGVSPGTISEIKHRTKWADIQ